jgi:hypothetical protein
MLRTYEAILVGDRIEFPGGGPPEPGPLTVHVTVIGAAGGAGANGHRERGAAMAAALDKLSQGGTLAAVTDPVEWQRQARRDRDLPGRPAPPQTPDAP